MENVRQLCHACHEFDSAFELVLFKVSVAIQVGSECDAILLDDMRDAYKLAEAVQDAASKMSDSEWEKLRGERINWHADTTHFRRFHGANAHRFVQDIAHGFSELLKLWHESSWLELIRETACESDLRQFLQQTGIQSRLEEELHGYLEREEAEGRPLHELRTRRSVGLTSLHDHQQQTLAKDGRSLPAAIDPRVINWLQAKYAENVEEVIDGNATQAGTPATWPLPCVKVSYIPLRELHDFLLLVGLPVLETVAQCRAENLIVDVVFDHTIRRKSNERFVSIRTKVNDIEVVVQVERDEDIGRSNSPAHDQHSGHTVKKTPKARRKRGRSTERTEVQKRILEVHRPGQRHSVTAEAARVFTEDGLPDELLVRSTLKAETERLRRLQQSTK